MERNWARVISIAGISLGCELFGGTDWDKTGST